MVGDKIKELRTRENMLQQDLADKLNVSKAAVGMWETNKRTPDLEMLKRISICFNVSLDWLTENSEYRNFEDYNENVNKESKIKLRSISRLENSEFTPEEDEQILDFINYIRSKRGE